MYTDIDFEYHLHISTTFNIIFINNTFTCLYEISTDGPIHIYYSESLSLMAKFN